MSDYSVKLIPRDPAVQVSSELAQRIVSILRTELNAEAVEVHITDEVEFIDCGSNLETIQCPVCGANLDFEWWGNEMDLAYKESHFKDLMTVAPCCQNQISLGDLIYEWPCAFACFSVEIRNPISDSERIESAVCQVEQNLGIPLKKITAHW